MFSNVDLRNFGPLNRLEWRNLGKINLDNQRQWLHPNFFGISSYGFERNRRFRALAGARDLHQILR